MTIEQKPQVWAKTFEAYGIQILISKHYDEGDDAEHEDCPYALRYSFQLPDGEIENNLRFDEEGARDRSFENQDEKVIHPALARIAELGGDMVAVVKFFTEGVA